MKKQITLLALSLSLISLSACQQSRSALVGMDKSFGKSNKANIEAHALTPDPKLKNNTFIPADRDRAKAARKAYRTGNVKDPKLTDSQSD